MNMAGKTGFALVRLLTSIVLVTFLLATGVPSLQDPLDNNQLRARSNNLVAALQGARSTTVTRRGDTFFCTRFFRITRAGNSGPGKGRLVFSEPDRRARNG